MIIQRTVIDPITETAILVGEGLPTGTDAPTGSLFVRKDGGSNNMVYVKYGNNASDWELLASGSGGGGLKTKSGQAANTAFGGTPLTASVTFSAAFSNTNYNVIVSAEDARAFTIQNKTSGSFVLNTNSKVGLSGTAYWNATAYGEN
jgi:hypothetical protein